MIRWLLLIPFALACGILSGAFFLLVASLGDPTLAPIVGETLFRGFWLLVEAIFASENPAPVVEGAFAGLGRLAFAFLVAPLALIALTGEVLRVRALAWHAGLTALLAAAMPWLLRGASARAASADELSITFALGLSGAVAGLVYWLIAGRSAGPSAPPRES